MLHSGEHFRLRSDFLRTSADVVCTAHTDSKPLAEFLRRMAISLEAGIDLRKALANEARRSPPVLRSRVESIRLNIDAGWTLAEAFRATGEYFPRLVRELVAVGEQTGHLPEVLHQLTEHYDQQIVLRQTFLECHHLADDATGLGLGRRRPADLYHRLDSIGHRLPNRHLGLRPGGHTRIDHLSRFFWPPSPRPFTSPTVQLPPENCGPPPCNGFVLHLPKIGKALHTLAVARFAWTLAGDAWKPPWN